MRRNKSYTFGGGRGGLDETLRAPNVFIFATEKEHNFQTDENIALLHLKRKKKNLSELTQVFCGLFSPLAAVVSLVTQRHLFPVKERARSVMRLNNDCGRDCVYFRSSNREKIKIIRLK